METDMLQPLFAPKTVALIGATEKMGFGLGQTRTMLESSSEAEVFPVSLSQKTVFGRRTYSSIA